MNRELELHYRDELRDARASPALASGGAGDRSFGRLYDLVHHGRNEALHQGAFARHVTNRAIDLALPAWAESGQNRKTPTANPWRRRLKFRKC
jgi:hypothetical protein